MASDIRAGRAFIELFLKDAAFHKGLAIVQAKFSALSAGVAGVARSAFFAGTAIAAPFIAGVKAFAGFEQQMARVSTVLDNPQAMIGGLSDGVKKLSLDFGVSTNTLSSGLYDILSSAIPAGEAINFLNASVKSAIAGMSDTATSTRTLVGMVNSFGLSADKATDISDLLFAVLKRGIGTYEQLAGSIGNVSSLVATAGISLEEFGAAIATITRAGVGTEETMTALNAIISSFLKPTDEARETAKKFGIEMSAEALKINGLYSMLEKMQGLKAEDLANIFPNIRAIRGIFPALRQLKGFKDDIEYMRNRSGATEAAYAEMAKTISFSFARVKQAIIQVFVGLGEIFAEPLKELSEALMRVASPITKMVRDNKELFTSIAKVVTAMLAASAATWALGKALAVIPVALSAIRFGFTSLSLLKTIIFTLFSPIGLLLSAIAGIGYALYKLGAFSGILSGLSDLFSSIGKTASVAMKGIKDALMAGDINLAARIMMQGIKVIMMEGWEALTRPIFDLKMRILRNFNEIVEGIKKVYNFVLRHINPFAGDELKTMVEIKKEMLVVLKGHDIKSIYAGENRAIDLPEAKASYLTDFEKEIDETKKSRERDAGYLKEAVERGNSAMIKFYTGNINAFDKSIENMQNHLQERIEKRNEFLKKYGDLEKKLADAEKTQTKEEKIKSYQVDINKLEKDREILISWIKKHHELGRESMAEEASKELQNVDAQIKQKKEIVRETKKSIPESAQGPKLKDLRSAEEQEELDYQQKINAIYESMQADRTKGINAEKNILAEMQKEAVTKRVEYEKQIEVKKELPEPFRSVTFDGFEDAKLFVENIKKYNIVLGEESKRISSMIETGIDSVSRVAVKGGFSAFNVLGFQAAGESAKIAENTKRTADGIDKLNKKDFGIVFE